MESTDGRVRDKLTKVVRSIYVPFSEVVLWRPPRNLISDKEHLMTSCAWLMPSTCSDCAYFCKNLNFSHRNQVLLDHIISYKFTDKLSGLTNISQSWKLIIKDVIYGKGSFKHSRTTRYNQMWCLWPRVPVLLTYCMSWKSKWADKQHISRGHFFRLLPDHFCLSCRRWTAVKSLICWILCNSGHVTV